MSISDVSIAGTLVMASGACRKLASGSDAPTTVTSVVWSSCVCSLPGGQAFHNPEISTAVPVDRLAKNALGSVFV